MQQRKMIDIPIGTEVRTANRAPVDGDYELVRHVNSSECRPSARESKVYKFRGELMPVCPHCGKRAIWKLVEYKFEVSSAIDKTPYVLKVVRGDRPDVPYPSGTKRS